MSALTACSFCILEWLKSRAKEEGKKLTVLYDAKWDMGGANVYIHPKQVIVSKLSGGEDGERKKYRVSWMMKIPKRCCCDD